jgi:uncharacterized protein YceH (UPF0502 family)
MIELSPIEARVIGVLIEKAQTTPESYPLTLNQVVNGANQKNNRHPVTNIDDGDAMSAVIALRNKGLIVQQDGPGQRVPKFRHQFKEKLGVNTPEMVILAELFWRGPQTLGELRGHASRMHPLESLEMVRNTLEQLANKPEPLVKQVPPARWSRAERYVQLMCRDLHDLDAAAEEAVLAERQPTAGGGGGGGLGERVEKLEREIATLRMALVNLVEELGARDPFAGRAEDAAPPSSTSGGQAS